MRWDDLFADLEGQLAQAGSAELAAEVADRSRHEAARIGLLDRVRGSYGARLTVRVRAVGAVEGELCEVGSAWLLLREPGGREALVPLSAVLAVGGVRATSAPAGSGGQVTARLGLTSVLRAVSRDRSRVTVYLDDASLVTGTLDRVGADFVEVADGEGGPSRSGTALVVPTAAVVLLRRQP